MKNKAIKFFSVILAVLCVFALVGCKDKDENTAIEPTKLSFKSAAGYEYLKTLNGEQVTISGYMATSSPVDGSFLFLMNLPYQNCPFCVPNTSQLSNTMEVYPKKGESFSYTTQAIKVVGTLVVTEDESKPFTDMYGYEFNYKIVDATYTIIKAEDMSADLALWQKIASTDVVNQIYKMYDYVYFLCAWNTYFVNSYVDENGETVKGYYLYPTDAMYYITTEGAQWNYGYQDGYFDGIVEKITAVDETAFSDLIANVRKAEALSKKAFLQLEEGYYTYEYKYVEKFDNEDRVYTLINGEELTSERKNIYMEFSDWLGSWEM